MAAKLLICEHKSLYTGSSTTRKLVALCVLILPFLIGCHPQLRANVALPGLQPVQAEQDQVRRRQFPTGYVTSKGDPDGIVLTSNIKRFEEGTRTSYFLMLKVYNGSSRIWHLLDSWTTMDIAVWIYDGSLAVAETPYGKVSNPRIELPDNELSFEGSYNYLEPGRTWTFELELEKLFALQAGHTYRVYVNLPLYGGSRRSDYYTDCTFTTENKK